MAENQEVHACSVQSSFGRCCRSPQSSQYPQLPIRYCFASAVPPLCTTALIPFKPSQSSLHLPACSTANRGDCYLHPLFNPDPTFTQPLESDRPAAHQTADLPATCPVSAHNILCPLLSHWPLDQTVFQPLQHMKQQSCL